MTALARTTLCFAIFCPLGHHIATVPAEMLRHAIEQYPPALGFVYTRQ